jgi:hypothetical protein
MTTVHVTRRLFLAFAPAAAGLLRLNGGDRTADLTPVFPSQDPDLVREVVYVAHGNLARLKELVSGRPALARATWDWGFGDWESPIDAASHMGNRPIAEFLLANGARPTLFTAAMLGNLPAVKAFLEAVPGAQRTRGPHGLTLLQHARAGGPAATDVAKYLEALGDADPRYVNLPLTDDERSAITGEYTFGNSSTERFRVAASARGDLSIQRVGCQERTLFHQGQLVFNPNGAEAVRIRFERTAGHATALVVEDGTLRVEARLIVSG